ncbi:MAG: M24 family metallopeptidase [Candidatus Thorarchaeota archaeon]
MVTEPLAYERALPKADRSKLTEYPTLSTKERDRRWRLIREMMGKNDVEALIVLQGIRREDDPCSYFANELPGTARFVFFPFRGDPVAFGSPHLLIIDTMMKSEAYGIESWIRDWRYVNATENEWVNLLKERNLTHSRIGIIGNGTFSRHSQQMIARILTDSIKLALPGVAFVDLWKPFVEVMLVKSPEEMAQFRKAALALEVACEEFVHACKPANTIADVENAFMRAVTPYGVDIWSLHVPACSIGFGPNGGRGISWLSHGLKPPKIRSGDLVCCELFCNVGLTHAQAQITVSIGEPTAEKRRLASLVREAYEIGLDMLRPGITFGELVEAMGTPHIREGAWDLSPLIHTMNPHEAVSNITRGIMGPSGFPGLMERFPGAEFSQVDMERPDLVIKEGMVFEFEPNGCFGAAYMDIGGNVIVTASGCEELNIIPTRVVVVDA